MDIFANSSVRRKYIYALREHWPHPPNFFLWNLFIIKQDKGNVCLMFAFMNFLKANTLVTTTRSRKKTSLPFPRSPFQVSLLNPTASLHYHLISNHYLTFIALQFLSLPFFFNGFTTQMFTPGQYSLWPPHTYTHLKFFYISFKVVFFF